MANGFTELNASKFIHAAMHVTFISCEVFLCIDNIHLVYNYVFTIHIIASYYPPPPPHQPSDYETLDVSVDLHVGSHRHVRLSTKLDII